MLWSLFVLELNVSHSYAFFQNLNPPLPRLNTNDASTSTTPLLQELESLIAESKDGIAGPGDVEQVKDLMIQISQTRERLDQRQVLSGEWELTYTTEKEISFFKTFWPFASVSSITQSLDLYDRQIVENYINFEGGGQFAVTGSVNAVDDNKIVGDGKNEEYDRVLFVFTDATILVWGKSISLPPTGAGWFDTMFCNGEYRLSRDSRGDYSVFRRLR